MTTQKNPYQVLRRRVITEKAVMLQQLQSADSNRCVRRCEAPKYVFIVDTKATKKEIARAVEQAYSKWGVRVTKVNTICVKGKRRRMRGRVGFTSGYKKAIITMERGDKIDEV